MARRGRGRGGLRVDGYDSYNYMYDYHNDSVGPHNFESWMSSGLMSSNGGAKHLRPGRDGYGPYNQMRRGRYGLSEPERGYGNRRAQHPPRPSHLGWRGDARGGRRGNFRPPRAVRGISRPMPPVKQATFQDQSDLQELRAFTGNSYFGGGFKPKLRKPWRNKKKLGADGGPAEKKIKPSTEDDGAKCEELESEDGEQEAAGTSTKTETEEKEEEAQEADKEQKPTANKKQQNIQSRRQRDRMVEMIQFVCSLCKFRTFYNEEMASHMQSDFHKEHFSYVGGKLPKSSADFLKEYVSYKIKRTEDRRNVIEDLNATVQQLYRDQDLTQDYGMEHFVKKVEAAHCSACDMFIPMNFSTIQRHTRTPQHNQNRKLMMENSKQTALVVARSILNNKMISQKLERYVKGENPFIEEQDEATGIGDTGVEASEEQEMEDTTDPSCENEDLAALNSSTTSAPDAMNSEDASDTKMTEDSEMCAPSGQDGFTDTMVEDSPHEQERSEDSEIK